MCFSKDIGCLIDSGVIDKALVVFGEVRVQPHTACVL